MSRASDSRQPVPALGNALIKREELAQVIRGAASVRFNARVGIAAIDPDQPCPSGKDAIREVHLLALITDTACRYRLIEEKRRYERNAPEIAAPHRTPVVPVNGMVPCIVACVFARHVVVADGGHEMIGAVVPIDVH